MIKFFLVIENEDPVEVFPKGINSLSVDYTIKNNRPFVSPEAKGSIILGGDDYRILKEIEEIPDYCPQVILQIVSDCNDVLPLKVPMTKAKWDSDNCQVEIQPILESVYKCFEDNEEVSVNLLELVPEKININLFEGDFEILECSGTGAMSGLESRFCGDNINWGWFARFRRELYTFNKDETEILNIEWQWQWVREYIITSDPMPEPWINIGGNKWVKQPNMHGYSYTDREYVGNTPSPPYYPQYVYLRSWNYGGIIDNGIRLKDVFTYWLGAYCPQITVKSDFFQWNPENPTNINYVTGLPSEVSNLVLFQRSDIKRPNASGNATIAEASIKEILDDLVNMFNLKWFINGSELVIEHVSYFDTRPTVDLISRYDSKIREGTNKYVYDIDNLPIRDIYQFTATKNYSSLDFKGDPIVYDSECAGLGDTKEEIYPINILFTDVQLCFDNPASDSNRISDENFVLIATTSTGGMIAREGILGESRLNNVLSISLLQERYFKHNRKFNSFVMNGYNKTAETTIYKKIQDVINVSYCCDEMINLNSFFQTPIGQGIVKSATFDIFNDTLSIELTYR